MVGAVSRPRQRVHPPLFPLAAPMDPSLADSVHTTRWLTRQKIDKRKTARDFSAFFCICHFNVGTVSRCRMAILFLNLCDFIV